MAQVEPSAAGADGVGRAGEEVVAERGVAGLPGAFAVVFGAALIAGGAAVTGAVSGSGVALIAAGVLVLGG